MTQIDAIQKKFLAKLEQKCVGNKSLTSVLRKAFRDVDLDNDGVISFPEWARVVEVAGSVLTDQESEFLFYFWDSMAGQREPQGLISVAVATNDLMARRAIHRRTFAGQFAARFVSQLPARFAARTSLTTQTPPLHRGTRSPTPTSSASPTSRARRPARRRRRRPPAAATASASAAARTTSGRRPRT